MARLLEWPILTVAGLRFATTAASFRKCEIQLPSFFPVSVGVKVTLIVTS
jgi:hypothetical protein